MKIFLAIILTIHGLIHLFGFAKAFDFADVKQLNLSISKPLGMVWLLAGLCCIITALLLVFKNHHWWTIGFISIVISQTLIIIFWQDAKFGTIVNVIVLIAALMSYQTSIFYGHYQHDVETCLRQKIFSQNELLSEQDISQLPEPIKKYIRYSGCLGKPKVNNFKITFIGKIRKDEHSAWMPLTSQQYNFIQTPTRLFFMNASMKKLPVTGYHCFKNGIAFMDIRLFSFFKVQWQDGIEMNRAETVTFFNDMCCMAPATLIDPRITWQTLDQFTVRAIFTNNHISITADLFLNEAGELINFKSNDRYNVDEKKQLPWSTPLSNYREINGYKLASYAEAIYSYPDKDMCYGIFNTQSVQYNLNSFE